MIKLGLFDRATSRRCIGQTVEVNSDQTFLTDQLKTLCGWFRLAFISNRALQAD